MRLPTLPSREPSAAALAATLAVAVAFGAALASGAVGMPGVDTREAPDPAFVGNVTETPTPGPSAETLPLTETSTDGPENGTVTDDPVTDPSGDPPTDTSTESDTPLTETDTETETAADNEPPEALFVAASLPLTAGEEAAFHASQSNDPDGEIVSYEWDFGDGGTATGERVNHTYEEVDQYEVTLTVTDDDGATDTLTQRYTAAEPRDQPTAEFYVEPDIPVADEEIDFVAEQSARGESEIVSYEWEFGDGTTATGQRVTHTFDSGGTYNVTLTVTNDDLGTDTVTRSLPVKNASYLPVADICHSIESVDVGEDVRFQSGDSAPPHYEDPVAYEWTFGDGTTATGETVTHVYESSGTYEVTLTVTGADGGTNTARTHVRVGEIRGLTCTGVE